MINVRVETVAEKPAYKHAFLNGRCLILASGFYEWKKQAGEKIPYYISLKDRKMFAFAGISSVWKASDGKIIKTCSIIAIKPNEFIKDIHDRIPVILPKNKESEWINPDNNDVKKLTSLLKSYPAKEMNVYEVSIFVNSPRNNSEECIQPV